MRDEMMTMPVEPAPLQYGGFWIRAAAASIDSCLLAALLTVPSFFWQAGSPKTWNAIGNPILLYVLPALLTLGFWARSGATPGKYWLGLRIVHSESPHSPARLPALVGRYLSYWLSLVCFGF